MKYVAFLDVLGFKDKLKSISQHDAKLFIEGFSSTVYSIFQNSNGQVNGFIVSDSVVLHTNDTTDKSLFSLISIVDEICKAEFSENGILIRGAVAKGEFDKIPAVELPELRKQLIVGQAYVDAYKLEGSLKSIGINLSNTVYQDMENSRMDYNVIEERVCDITHYLLRYLTIDYLLVENNLKRFIDLAKKSEWLPHYYNAIYFAMKNEKNDKQIDQVFFNIQNVVCENRPGENWRDIDIFIKNAFVSDVIENFKKRFLRYIRQSLFANCFFQNNQ